MGVHQNFINGDWAQAREQAPNINPSNTSDVVGEFARGDEAQARAAIAAARAAAPAWARGPIQARADMLDKIGNEILARKDELGTLLAREEGKTKPEAVGEATRAGYLFKFFAGEVVRQAGEVLPSVRPGVKVEITREPVGVVGIITPWNFPIAIPAWKIAPALAYGNCVVFKPADLVPGCAWALAEIISKAGVPAGVFNLVMGRGSVLGDTISKAPGDRRGELHRLGRRRQEGGAELCCAPRQGAARDGRQEPAGGAGRRRPRRGGEPLDPERVLLHRPALHGFQPPDRHAGHS